MKNLLSEDDYEFLNSIKLRYVFNALMNVKYEANGFKIDIGIGENDYANYFIEEDREPDYFTIATFLRLFLVKLIYSKSLKSIETKMDSLVRIYEVINSKSEDFTVCFKIPYHVYKTNHTEQGYNAHCIDWVGYNLKYQDENLINVLLDFDNGIFEVYYVISVTIDEEREDDENIPPEDRIFSKFKKDDNDCYIVKQTLDDKDSEILAKIYTESFNYDFNEVKLFSLLDFFKSSTKLTKEVKNQLRQFTNFIKENCDESV